MKYGANSGALYQGKLKKAPEPETPVPVVEYELPCEQLKPVVIHDIDAVEEEPKETWKSKKDKKKIPYGLKEEPKEEVKEELEAPQE